MKKALLLCYSICISLIVFSQGYYIEFKMSTNNPKYPGTGSIKIYYQDGDTRSDITMALPQLAAPMQMSALVLKSNPGKQYLVNDNDKTYTEVSTEGEDLFKDHPVNEYEITVVGNEKVNGYNCVHLIVKVNGKRQMEMWTTKEIPGYSDLAKVKSKYTGKENMFKALAAKNAEGMAVRIKSDNVGTDIQLDLVTAEKRANPSAIFSISGYTKKDASDLLPDGQNQQQLLEKLKNMSPQEREEMLRKLQQQYKQN